CRQGLGWLALALPADLRPRATMRAALAEDGLGSRAPEVAGSAAPSGLAETSQGRPLGDEGVGGVAGLALRHGRASRSASRICWSAASTEVRATRVVPARSSTASTFPYSSPDSWPNVG